MSIIGIDFGNKNTCIAMAKRNGIDVIANETSNRLTPCMVAFTAKERMIGEAALSGQRSNVKNTISDVKRILGCTPSENAYTDEEIKRLPFKCSLGEDGNYKYEVQYQGETTQISTIQAAAAILTKLRQTAELDQGTKVADCVISVPAYWPDHRRRALLDAAKIAGLHVLRIMNDTTAAALQYGITKKPEELPEDKEGEDGRLVLFIDSGHADTSFAVARFVRGKVTMLATSQCSTFGGRNVDDVVCAFFCDMFKEKYKLDIRSSPKAYLRLMGEAEKVKKVLCGIERTSINIDCLMEDTDMSGEITRDALLEALLPTIEAKLTNPLQNVLVSAGVEVKHLFSVEVVGGNMYLPSLQDFLKKQLEGKELSKTLNQSEAVARGCALQAAMLSPSFRVREFAVHDSTPYAIRCTFKALPGAAADMEVSDDSNVVIKPGNAMPSTKKMSYEHRVPFELTATYDDAAAALLPVGTPTEIGKYTCAVMPEVGADTYKSELDVTMRLNLSGLFSMEKVEITEKYEKEVEEPIVADAAADGDKKKDDKKEDGEKMETADGAAPTTQKVMKKKKRTVDVVASGDAIFGLKGNDMTVAVEAELQMILNDRIVTETMEKKNAIEAYLFDTRRRLYEDLSDFISEEARTAFCATIDATEDWLYEDGEDCSKAIYSEKLIELHKLGDPCTVRKSEFDARPTAIASLTSVIDSWKALAASTEEKYAHIAEEERAKVTTRCTEYGTWMAESTAAIDALAKTEDAAVKAADFELKSKALVSFAKPIMNKAKPAPPPPTVEPVAEAKTEEGDAKPATDEAKPEPMAADGDVPAAEGDKAAADPENPMDLD